jgi:uncharacterized protein
MKRAIIIHGWENKPEGQWIPWVKEQLEKDGWSVETPEMPNTFNPNASEWMDMLVSLTPDRNTLLIGHSLANALIMKYLEKKENEASGAILVAAWDWLMEDVKEFHETFFDKGFNFEAIKEKKLPLVVMNSVTDPYIDFGRSQQLANKLDARFVGVENAGHFTIEDGYTEFPELLDVIKSI